MGWDLSFDELRDLSGDRDVADVICPLCVNQCKTPAGRKRLCLRIWDEDEAFIRFSCARCGAKGFATPDQNNTNRPKYTKKEQPPKEDKTPLVNRLWNESLPGRGSLVETYLRSRACFPEELSTAIRFLPAKDKYPPTMVTRFGDGQKLTGIHMTRLRPDGKGKAGTDNDKIIMGDCMGQPIILHDGDEERIIISEGIEDAESLFIACPWTIWAAGTANRIPAIVAEASRRGFQTIYVAGDIDLPNMKTGQKGAGQRAIENSRTIAPIVPLTFGRIIGRAERMDANSLLRLHGVEYLRSAIDWCVAQEDFRTGRLTTNQFRRANERLKTILQP